MADSRLGTVQESRMRATAFGAGRGSFLENAACMRGNLATIVDGSSGSPAITLEEVGVGVEKLAPQVLVVDDEALIRWSVAETLANRGMHVSQASDGASAIAVLAQRVRPFDVVVLDLRLPDVDDLSLLAKVREMSPTSRVIIMTAFGTPEVTAQAVDLGASRVIPKPFELEELAALVERASADA